MNNYNDYLNYFNNQFTDMNYLTDTNNMIQDMNYSNAFQNTFMKYNQQNQITDSYQGFLRGNMFDNLYQQYRNYQPIQPKSTSQRDKALQQIQQLKFAMIDLNLYLDVNPNDKEALQLFNSYRTQEKQLCDQFESMYGPLTLDSNALNANTWMWDNKPWPWEVQQ